MAPQRLSDFLRALSARPEHVWPDGVVHHGFRGALLLGLVLLLHTLWWSWLPTVFPAIPVMFALGGSASRRSRIWLQRRPSCSKVNAVVNRPRSICAAGCCWKSWVSGPNARSPW